jgi:uncharacterized YigZ family protein
MYPHKTRQMINSNTNSGEDVFLQIKGPKRVEVKLKGSRFIASAGKVTTEEEVAVFLEQVAKEYPDATHHCFAWRVGSGKKGRYRYSDNGEPSGTAGLPIFRVIEGRKFSNIIIIVTRYFGGIKLGTGGLIRAYSKSATDVLKECVLEKSYPMETATIKTSIEFVSLVQHIISSFKATLVDSVYGEQPTFTIEIRASKFKEFKTKLRDATNGQVEIIK